MRLRIMQKSLYTGPKRVPEYQKVRFARYKPERNAGAAETAADYQSSSSAPILALVILREKIGLVKPLMQRYVLARRKNSAHERKLYETAVDMARDGEVSHVTPIVENYGRMRQKYAEIRRIYIQSICVGIPAEAIKRNRTCLSAQNRPSRRGEANADPVQRAHVRAIFPVAGIGVVISQYHISGALAAGKFGQAKEISPRAAAIVHISGHKYHVGTSAGYNIGDL